MSIRLSVYNGVKDTQGVQVSIDAVVERIRNGAKGLDEKTRMSNILSQTDSEAYKSFKEMFPAVTWAGTFSKRSADDLLTHSGFCVLDVDDTLDIGGVLSDFANNPHVAYAFISPSGTGVKPIIPVNPIPKNDFEHKQAFAEVLDTFEDYVIRDAKQIAKQSDVSRLCFLAHDAKIFTRQNPIPVEWDFKPEPIQSISDKETYKGDIDVEALEYIPKDLGYHDWLAVGMGIKAAGLPVSVFEDWCEGKRLNSKGVWVAEDCKMKWASFKRSGVTWGSVVHLAKIGGYKPKRQVIQKPLRTDKPITKTRIR